MAWVPGPVLHPGLEARGRELAARKKQAPHLMPERFKDSIVSAILSGKAGREIGTVKTVLNQTKALWEVVATQGRGQLCGWDGCQAGFLEEVTEPWQSPQAGDHQVSGPIRSRP